MSCHLVCSALVVATLTLAACSSACVQTQNAHSPAAQALADLRATAEAGDAAAQFILGGMYVTGVGVPQDDVAAVAWYRRAAEQGHARAQYNLGAMYAEGDGVPQDAAAAVAWYRRAAEQGDATAQNNLGAMYAEGLGVPQDAAAAVAWYRRAAEQGDATAQSNLGRMHDQGLGVPQDAAAAVAWYRRAAEQGDARAQYNLGGMYREGRGVPPDAVAAVAWYRRAAEQGHTRAQYNLGGMYAEGLGVPPDAVEALMWLTIAAARATVAEREHMVTARAAGAARMTPTDVREAERRAQAWHAAHQGGNRAAPPSDTGREGTPLRLGDCRREKERNPATPLPPPASPILEQHRGAGSSSDQTTPESQAGISRVSGGAANSPRIRGYAHDPEGTGEVGERVGCSATDSVHQQAVRSGGMRRSRGDSTNRALVAF